MHLRSPTGTLRLPGLGSDPSTLSPQLVTQCPWDARSHTVLYVPLSWAPPHAMSSTQLSHCPCVRARAATQSPDCPDLMEGKAFGWGRSQGRAGWFPPPCHGLVHQTLIVCPHLQCTAPLATTTTLPHTAAFAALWAATSPSSGRTTVSPARATPALTSMAPLVSPTAKVGVAGDKAGGDRGGRISPSERRLCGMPLGSLCPS